MFINIQVYVKLTVDVMVGDVEDRQEHLLFFWVRWIGTENEREDAINQARNECRHLGWTPYLPEYWEVKRVIISGRHIFKTNSDQIIEMPATVSV